MRPTHLLRAGCLVAALVLVAPPAHATEGLVETGDTTWVVDPTDGEVTATIDLALRHVIPDGADGSFTFFDGYGIVLPYVADDVSVTWQGQAVTARTEQLADGFFEVSWSFPDDLRYGETDTGTVTATFTSAPPRADVRDGPRIQPEYVSLLVAGYGSDDGRVQVRIPATINAEMAPEWDRERDGDDIVWTVEGAGPNLLHAVIGSGPSRSAQELTTTVAGTTITVQPWANDPGWGEQVLAFTELAVPALVSLTGDSFDGDELTIRETADPERLGWGGWYDPRAERIEIGELIDRETWTHELAHRWFNTDEFSEAWLREGMAEMATTLLADELDLDAPVPPAPDDEVVLIDWDRTIAAAATDRHEDPQAYHATTRAHYDGAHNVLGAIADEIGHQDLATVVRAMITEQSAWDGPGVEIVDPASGWRELVDLVEVTSGWMGTGDLVVATVDPTAAAVIARRDEVVADYHVLADGDWAAPLQVRNHMQAWNHELASIAIQEATGVRDEIDRLQTEADRLEMGMPDLQELWETGRLEDLAQPLVDIDHLAADVARADTVARDAGLSIPALATVVTLDTLPDVADHVAAVAETIEVVTDARAIEAPDWVEQVGLWGTDSTALADAAESALASGDLAAARSRSVELVELGDGARRVGTTRLVVVFGLLALGAIVVGLLARRRRRGHATVA